MVATGQGHTVKSTFITTIMVSHKLYIDPVVMVVAAVRAAGLATIHFQVTYGDSQGNS